MLRSVSLLALLTAAAASQAVVAYSNKPAGDYFANGYRIGPDQSVGFLFSSTATGTLTGFDVALNNFLASGPSPFTLRLYADAGGTLGSLLGTFSGTNSGRPYPTTSGYDAVAAGGVGLTRGTSYWLVASSLESLNWNLTDGTTLQATTYTVDGVNFLYSNVAASAFSVNVADAAPAVPGPVAALPFALIVLNRRRKRA